MNGSELPLRVVDGFIRPLWLTVRGQPDVEQLLDTYDAGVGKRRAELDRRLEHTSTKRLGRPATALLRAVLDDVYPSKRRDGPEPRLVRLAVFDAAAQLPDRAQALRAAGLALGIEDREVEGLLLADLPGERLVQAPAKHPSAAEIIERANQLLLLRLCGRADSLTIRATGAAKAVGAALRRSRLIAEIRESPSHSGGTVLRLSGPLSLHRRTTIYGRALARFVRSLAWCSQWHLAARCHVGNAALRLECSHRDPVLGGAAGPPPRFDSQIEERFYRAFLRRAPGWRLQREPRPISLTGGGQAIPDFEASRIEEPSARAFIEIVGFWTPEYLRRKLEALRQAHLGRYVLCVDETLGVHPGQLPGDATVIPYRRSVDVDKVLSALERMLPTGDCQVRPAPLTRIVQSR